MIPYCDFTCTEDLCKESPNVDTTGVNEKSPMPTTNDFVGDPYDVCFMRFSLSLNVTHTQRALIIHMCDFKTEIL